MGIWYLIIIFNQNVGSLGYVLYDLKRLIRDSKDGLYITLVELFVSMFH